MEARANPSPNLALPVFTQHLSIKCVTIKCAISTDRLKNVNWKTPNPKSVDLFDGEVRHVFTRRGEDDTAVLLSLTSARGAEWRGSICVATLLAPTQIRAISDPQSTSQHSPWNGKKESQLLTTCWCLLSVIYFLMSLQINIPLL